MTDWLLIDYVGQEDKPFPRLALIREGVSPPSGLDPISEIHVASSRDLDAAVLAIGASGTSFDPLPTDARRDGYVVTVGAAGETRSAFVGMDRNTASLIEAIRADVSSELRDLLMPIANRLAATLPPE
mgnify:CR=1 FL=1